MPEPLSTTNAATSSSHIIMPKRPSLLQPEFINMPCPTHHAPLFVRGKIRDLVDAYYTTGVGRARRR